MDTKDRLKLLSEVLEGWLHADNQYLREAIDRTVNEGYFSFPDVKHALLTLKEAVGREALEQWVNEAGLADSGKGQNRLVLCLHAGNLPLVGFQDALAVLLSGSRYTGKISRKDPYLLPTFLNEVKNTEGWSDMDVQWSHRLDDFEGMRHNAVLFAGSESSVPPVRESIDQLDLARSDTRYLIRTAHFSVAYLDRQDSSAMEDLTEAIFRYGGMGCRSVAAVVSPFPLDEIKCDLTDYIESFWLKNPQHRKPPPKLKHRFAYNKAVQRSQAWLDDFLLQEGEDGMEETFTCNWVTGDEQTAAELADRHRGELQSVYVTDSDTVIPGWEERTELLSRAQSPPIRWKPDGTDILKWLSEGDG